MYHVIRFSTDEMRAGDMIGGFEIERPARRGGMGTIYRARDPQTGEWVALKVLGDLADHGGDADRFLREAKILAELRHPAIVRYVSHGRAPSGEHYLAMEWLDGQDLRERLREVGLTVAESLRVVGRVAEGLVEAHRRGVVHRDLKPANVFLPECAVDRAKLLDFGVARPAASAEQPLTQTGTMVGTPAYMSPEQVRGGKDVDARTDVFALGALLFECLTGRPAFVADHLLAVLARLLFEEAPRVGSVRPDVPPALDQLVARMLSKDPRERPSDAAAVIAEIVALGAVAGGPAPPAEVRPALSDAERRVVSVVFAGEAAGDPNGSLTHLLSVDRDPGREEQLRAVAARFGARLERITGGTIAAALAASGPAVDQAIDAARLALALRTFLPGSPMSLATGRGVVVGGLPVGDALDRAARLLETHGDGIWLDSTTAALLESRFEIDTSDSGLCLVAERTRLGDARRLLGRPTTCVGRDRELTTLDAVWGECAGDSVARAVLVTAPSGVGKSRLRHEWLERLAERRDPGLVLLCRCDPMSAGAPFVLVAQAIRVAAGLHDGDPPAQQRERLRAYLGDVRMAAFLGELCGLPPSDDDPEELRVARATPINLGDQMRLAWEDWLAKECARRPVLLVLEDLHWGDAPSVRFVDAALRHLRDQPFMVLALARRDVHDLFPSLWGERDLQEIRLAELPRRASERLVREVLGQDLPAERVARIIERAGGNALYLEELIRAVVEGQDDRTVPDTVLAMVQARLQGLPAEARRVLRAASVFGEVFWGGGVARLVGSDTETVAMRGWLDDLAQREIVTRRRESRFPLEIEYQFRHAYFRDAAYGTLTDADRTLGHRMASDWLLAAGERQPLVLAEHLERGGEPAQAISWYERAAEEALAGNDYAGAIKRAGHGIDLLAEGVTLGRLRLLQAEAHNWLAEHRDAEQTSEEAFSLLPRRSARWYQAAKQLLQSHLPARKETLARLVLELAESPSDPDARAPYVIAVTSVAHQLTYHGDGAGARAALATCERLSDGADDATVAWVERGRAALAHYEGKHDVSRVGFHRAAERFDAIGDLRNACAMRVSVGWLEATELGLHDDAARTLAHCHEVALRLGTKRAISGAKQNWGVALMRLHRYADSERMLLETVAEFDQQEDPRMVAGSYYYLSMLHTAQGDFPRGQAAAERALQLALAHDVRTTTACSLAALSRLLVAAGRPAEALPHARRAQEILDQLGGIEEGESLIRLVVPEALAALGQLEEARRTAKRALDRLHERANLMLDETVRHAFLHAVPEDARTLSLAGELGIT
jgi:eukaryotic-like serine/threonine-protein kinase